VLGHFRHEAGHYFYSQLAREAGAFGAMFGDPAVNYASALENYYAQGPAAGWEYDYVSAYASSHPLEDWAECFAHYLHIQDTLETAVVLGLVEDPGPGLSDRLASWVRFSLQFNEVSRSLGLRDAYPFVLTPPIIAKLEFVEAAVSAAAKTATTA
jgi:hypothetical protein